MRAGIRIPPGLFAGGEDCDPKKGVYVCVCVYSCVCMYVCVDGWCVCVGGGGGGDGAEESTARKSVPKTTASSWQCINLLINQSINQFMKLNICAKECAKTTASSWQFN